MAATFDIGKSEGRDRFPNLDKACQLTIECIQVSYFFAFYTAVWLATVNIAFKIQERLYHLVRTLLVSPMLILSLSWSLFHICHLISYKSMLAW